MKRRGLLLPALITCLFCSNSCNAQDADDPFAANAASRAKASAGDSPGWSSAGPGSEGWRGGAAVIAERDPITSGGLGCPVIVAGNKVFSTESFEQTSLLEAEYHSNTLTALSGDGSYFAVASKTHNQDDTSVAVYDVATGKQVSQIPGAEDEILDILRITRNKYVVTAGRSVPKIRVYNATDGQLVKEFELGPRARADQGNVAFTSDGKHMAVIDDKVLNVIDVAQSKVVATMEPPRLSPESNNSGSTDHIFIYAWVQDMQFSPTGTELAAVSTHRGNRVLCWNQRAKLEVNQTFSLVQGVAFWQNDLQWLPDGAAWLVAGNLIDRATGKVLLAFQTPFASDVRLFVHDQNTIIGRIGSAPNQLSKVAIPWEEVARSRKAMEEKTPAFVAPYQSVDVKVEFGNSRGGDAEQQIREAIEQRLARDDIKIESGATDYFLLRISETEGDTLPIYERQSRFDFRGHKTDRTMTEAKGRLVLEFYADGATKPLWREALDASSSRSFREEITQQAVRKSMIANLSNRLAQIHFPYFMPKDDSLVALPIIVQ